MGLPGDSGPRSQAYHRCVYQRLSDAIVALECVDNIGAALEKELDAMADELLANPHLLDMGR